MSWALRGVDPHHAADYRHLYRQASTRFSALTTPEVIRYRRLQRDLPPRARVAIERAAVR